MGATVIDSGLKCWNMSEMRRAAMQCNFGDRNREGTCLGRMQRIENTLRRGCLKAASVSTSASTWSRSRTNQGIQLCTPSTPSRVQWRKNKRPHQTNGRGQIKARMEMKNWKGNVEKARWSKWRRHKHRHRHKGPAEQSRARENKKTTKHHACVLSSVKKEVVHEAQQAFENHMRSFRFGSSIQSGEMACVSLCRFFFGVRSHGHASPRKRWSRWSRRGSWLQSSIARISCAGGGGLPKRNYEAKSSKSCRCLVSSAPVGWRVAHWWGKTRIGDETERK